MIEIIDLNFQQTKRSTASFFIETSEGPIIVETGPHSTIAQIEHFLKQKAYTLSDIKHVFLTHIHLDHAGAAWAFAERGANIYLHPIGKKHMADPSKLLHSAQRIYKDKMFELWGDLRPIPINQLKTFEHGEQITIGDTTLVAWHTPGHAIHHIAWQIGTEMIAGDVAGVKIGKEGMVVPPCPPPDINIEHWINSIELLETLDLEAIYLTHFGKITELTKHFAELKAILWDWANWMRPFFDENKSPEEIIPLFSKHVEQQLINFGASPEMLQSYEKANPSSMSVAGLLRYWKKRQRFEKG